MKEITTAGITFSLDPVKINDVELFELLGRLKAKDMMAVPKLVAKILDDEQKEQLYAAIRTEDGRVPLEVVVTCVSDIITQLGKN